MLAATLVAPQYCATAVSGIECVEQSEAKDIKRCQWILFWHLVT